MPCIWVPNLKNKTKTAKIKGEKRKKQHYLSSRSVLPSAELLFNMYNTLSQSKILLKLKPDWLQIGTITSLNVKLQNKTVTINKV